MIDFFYQNNDSLIHKIDPTIKFAALILLSILILLTNGLLCFILSGSIILVLIILGNLDCRKVFKLLKRLSCFFIMIFIMNALFYNGNSCLYKLSFICISEEGLRNGLNIILHTFFITVISFIFIQTTTSVEIMKGIERLLKPLQFIGIPVHEIALIISIALQFIPVFYADFDRIRKAQIARGADFTDGKISARIKAILPLVIPAFVSAFRRADELSLAMEARGFNLECDQKDL